MAKKKRNTTSVSIDFLATTKSRRREEQTGSHGARIWDEKKRTNQPQIAQQPREPGKKGFAPLLFIPHTNTVGFDNSTLFPEFRP